MARLVGSLMTDTPASVDELVHLMGCFDYSLLGSACAAVRKMALIFGAALIYRLLECKFTAAGPPRTIRGPFVLRANFLHLNFSQAVNRAVEGKYMKSYLSKHSNTLFNYTVQSSNRSTPLILDVCLDRTLQNLSSPRFLDCLPDPETTSIFIYLPQGTQHIVKNLTWNHTTPEEYGSGKHLAACPDACGSPCAAQQVNTLLAPRADPRVVSTRLTGNCLAFITKTLILLLFRIRVKKAVLLFRQKLDTGEPANPKDRTTSALQGRKETLHPALRKNLKEVQLKRQVIDMFQKREKTQPSSSPKALQKAIRSFRVVRRLFGDSAAVRARAIQSDNCIQAVRTFTSLGSNQATRTPSPNKGPRSQTQIKFRLAGQSSEVREHRIKVAGVGRHGTKSADRTPAQKSGVFSRKVQTMDALPISKAENHLEKKPWFPPTHRAKPKPAGEPKEADEPGHPNNSFFFRKSNKTG